MNSGEASALCLVMQYCASAGGARPMLFRGVRGVGNNLSITSLSKITISEKENVFDILPDFGK